MSPWILRQATRTITAGGVIAYPTEAVYGLGCNPLNPLAVYRLLELKRRSPDRGLILVAADFEQLSPFLSPVSKTCAVQALRTWPGPHTWLWPAHPVTPDWLTGAHDTLAVRVSDHPMVRDLCNTFGGALVSTSANRSGQPAATTSLGVQKIFGDEVDLVLHGNTGDRRVPTPIRDLKTGRTIRHG